MEVVPALERLGHEDCEFGASLECIESQKTKRKFWLEPGPTRKYHKASFRVIPLKS